MTTTIVEEQFVTLKEHPRYATATMTRWDLNVLSHGFLVTIPELVLPLGWNRRTATVAFWVSAYYLHPNRGFWTLPNLWLDTGFRTEAGYSPRWTAIYPDHQPPGHTKAMWWMWRPRMWSANNDNLLTLARFIHRRFDLVNEIYDSDY